MRARTSFRQEAKRPSQSSARLSTRSAIAVDADVGVDDLVDFHLVDVEVDDARVGGEVLHVARDAVIEAGAHGDEQVAVRNGHVGRVGAVHAGHAEVQVPRVRHAAFAHEGRDDGNARLFHDVADQGRRSARDDAAAREEEGLLRLAQGLDGRHDIFLAALDVAVIAPQMYCFGVFKFQFAVEDIFGDIDEDRARTARAGDIEGFPDDAGQVFDVLDEVVVLRDGRRDARNVRFLEGVAADQVRGDLAAEHDQGDGIHVGRGDAGDHVAHAGSRCSEADPGASRGAGVAVGRVHGALLVARQDVGNVRFIQFIVKRQHGSAGVAEDHLHVFPFQALDECLRTDHSHNSLS